MERKMSRLATALGLLSMLAGCGKTSPVDQAQSRLAEATTLDVCAFVSQADVEGIFGPLVGPPQNPLDRRPQPAAPSRGLAGACGWYFKTASGYAGASASARFVTPASNVGNPYPLDPWSKVNMGEVEANFGPNPVAVDGLGDKALLFQAPQQLQAELWMQQGRTYAVVKISGASSAQLVSLARLLASGAIAMETAAADTTAAGQSATVASRQSPGSGEPANGQERLKDAEKKAADADAQARDAEALARDAADKLRQDQGEEQIVLRQMVEQEVCARADDLLRKSCAAYGRLLTDENKPYCNLPAETFAARTASSFRDFKDSYSAAIQKHQSEISDAIAEASVDFDQQYAQARAGTVSGMDLFSLSHDLGRCP